MSLSFDDLTPDQLREQGWKKWTEYPGATGAWIAEMDFGTAPAVQQVLHRAADGDGLGYLSSNRLRALQDSITRFLADRYRWTVATGDIRPVSDVLTAFEAAVRLSEPGSPIILPTPAYMPFLTIPQLLDREIIQVPLACTDGYYSYDLDALDAAFAAGGRLLVLCNPHNPVGRVLHRTELQAISEVVYRHGGRVFADEIHAPLRYPGHEHIPYASISAITAAHTLTAISASKAFNLPGLKCAQVVLSNDPDRQAWNRVGPLLEDQASTLGALAATAAYSEGGPWLAQVLEYLDGNRQALALALQEHLPHVRYRVPEGTYLAWLDFRRAGAGGAALADPAALLRQHADIVATPGQLCGEAGQGFLRLNFATSRPILIDLVRRMAAAIRAR
ncbi:MAG: MalY/PatB family protein [Beutenbergiaceae bacterium]